MFYITTSTFTLVFMYYIMAFCAVYKTAAVPWLLCSIVNLILSWGCFQFLNPVSNGLVRGVVRVKPNY
jgi:hypothetical protein